MNRHERRRQKAMSRQDSFYNTHVRHLPEIPREEAVGKGVFHAVHFHEGWCPIYSGKACTCEPEVKFYREPTRN